MSSLTTQNADANLPIAPRGVAWIDVKTAAGRLRSSERWIVALCSTAWSRQGLARLETPAGGRKGRWMIREDADRGLGRILPPERLRADTRGMTEQQRELLNWRLATYQAWEAACCQAVRGGVTIERATQTFLLSLQIRDGDAIVAKTLYRWRKDYRREGLTGLMDGRWMRETGAAKPDDPFLKEVERLWLMPNRMSVQLCYDFACEKAAAQGWRVWSYRTAERHVHTINPAVRIYRRVGEKAFTNEAEMFIERDYSALASNGLWNSDHHRFDVMIEVPGGKTNTATGEVKRRFSRPWLTVFQDCRSRKIVGWTIFDGDPNTDSILLALRHAVLSHGIPDECLTDNGRDFLSYALHGRTKKERNARRKDIDPARINGVFTTLGIVPHNAQRFHGQSKLAERLFRTLEERFGKLFPTYCGNKPENKPEGLQDRLDAGKAPTLEDVTAAFAEWVEKDYNAAPHHGDSMGGKSPNQVFAENLATTRTAPVELLDVMLQKQSRPVKVTQNGVTWNGLRYGNTNPALHPLLGEKVTLRVDPADVSRVTVWTMEGKFVCAAASNRRLPPNADPKLLNEAMAEKRRDRKVKLQYNEARLRLQDDLPERMARMAVDRNKRRLPGESPEPLPPTTIRPVRSNIEGELPALQRAIQAPALRQAAGGETMDCLALANEELALAAPRAQFRSSFSLLTALNDDAPADAGEGA